MVRRASTEDQPHLEALVTHHWPAWTLEGFRGELERPQGMVWCADDPSLGFAMGWVAAGTSEVSLVLVAPEARGRGLGMALVEAFLGGVAMAGAGECWLEVRPTNDAALAVYRKAGFEERGRRPRYYDDGEDALVLRWVAPC